MKHKQYKLVYDKYLFDHLILNHTRYMLHKKFLFWYFPLIVKEYISSPYDRALDRTTYHMEATSMALMVNFFKKGKLTQRSFLSARPTWYFIAKGSSNTLKEEYFDDLEDFLNKKAEYLI